jgi:hypothetical protein
MELWREPPPKLTFDSCRSSAFLYDKLGAMGLTFATWMQVALTAAIAVAAFMQWLVYKQLSAIEVSREKVRIALRFARNPQSPDRLSLRVANLSSFGVLIERINYSIRATYPDGHETFQEQIIIEWPNVLAAFSICPFDLHTGILETIQHRNARFRCEIQATVVYLDKEVIRTTPSARVTTTIEQQRLAEFPESKVRSQPTHS